jgi:hypothetical protein
VQFVKEFGIAGLGDIEHLPVDRLDRAVSPGHGLIGGLCFAVRFGESGSRLLEASVVVERDGSAFCSVLGVLGLVELVER